MAGMRRTFCILASLCLVLTLTSANRDLKEHTGKQAAAGNTKVAAIHGVEKETNGLGVGIGVGGGSGPEACDRCGDCSARGCVPAAADVPGIQIPGIQIPGMQIPGIQIPGLQIPGISIGMPGGGIGDSPGCEMPGGGIGYQPGSGGGIGGSPGCEMPGGGFGGYHPGSGGGIGCQPGSGGGGEPIVISDPYPPVHVPLPGGCPTTPPGWTPAPPCVPHTGKVLPISTDVVKGNDVDDVKPAKPEV